MNIDSTYTTLSCKDIITGGQTGGMATDDIITGGSGVGPTGVSGGTETGPTVIDTKLIV